VRIETPTASETFWCLLACFLLLRVLSNHSIYRPDSTPRDRDMDAPSLEVFKAKVDRALGSLI